MDLLEANKYSDKTWKDFSHFWESLHTLGLPLGFDVGNGNQMNIPMSVEQGQNQRIVKTDMAGCTAYTVQMSPVYLRHIAIVHVSSERHKSVTWMIE